MTPRRLWAYVHHIDRRERRSLAMLTQAMWVAHRGDADSAKSFVNKLAGD
jgi:hypothetical protein